MGLRPARIGLFGGAFDPPHNAHLALARTAIAELALDRLHVVPTGHAWHKERALTDSGERLALCQLAFAGVARTRVDARELRRAGPSYTADTLRELGAEEPAATLYLLIGTDQAAVFRTWHRADEILRRAELAIAVRGAPAARGKPVFDARVPLPGLAPDPARIHILRLAPMKLSATALRRRIARGLDVGGQTPAAVAAYIEHHHLYRNPA
jgi:nicotinate-nucleotide adenylyltransferase